MEDDLDIDSFLDSMNLTGQWQPSSMPAIVDPSLNIQILDDIDLSVDGMLPASSLNTNDDISSALIDTAMNSFDIDDISKFISTPIGEVPRQSTIEENLENEFKSLTNRYFIIIDLYSNG